MALITLRLFIDIDGKTLVQSDTKTDGYTIPPLIQGDTVNLQVTLLQRTSFYPQTYGANLPYSKVSVSGLSLRVGIGSPTAATGSSAPSIYQNTFTQNTTDNRFEGKLVLTASAITTILGSATSGSSTLEIEVAESGEYTTVYQGAVSLRAELIESGAADAPQPTDSYYTKAETNATFHTKSGEAGNVFVLKSPDGSKTCYLYLDNDGVVHQDIA